MVDINMQPSPDCCPVTNAFFIPLTRIAVMHLMEIHVERIQSPFTKLVCFHPNPNPSRLNLNDSAEIAVSLPSHHQPEDLHH